MALQNHKLCSDRFFPTGSKCEGPRSKFDWEDGQTKGEKWHVRGFVTSVVLPRNNAKSSKQFKRFPISRNQLVCDLLYETCHARPRSRLEFLTQPRILSALNQRHSTGLIIVTKIFRPYVCRCSCSNFDLGLFSIELYSKKMIARSDDTIL